MRTHITLRSSILVSFGILLLVGKMQSDETYYRGYNAALPLNTAIQDTRQNDGYKRIKFYYDSTPDSRVPGLMVVPDAASPTNKIPCVIFLHGIGQDKEFLDVIAGEFVKYGTAIATYDQYMQGERDLPKGASATATAVAFRERPRKTVIDARRLIDYVSTLPEIDADRIYLVGASYGAITGATTAAFDQRIKATVLVYGGGDWSKMLGAREIQNAVGPIVPVARLIAEPFLGVADPVKYIGQISPRPVYLQNGRNDGLIATEAAEALQNAAKEPKKISWYDSDHLNDEAIVRQVLEDAMNWLKEQDAALVAARAAAPAK